MQTAGRRRYLALILVTIESLRLSAWTRLSLSCCAWTMSSLTYVMGAQEARSDGGDRIAILRRTAWWALLRVMASARALRTGCSWAAPTHGHTSTADTRARGSQSTSGATRSGRPDTPCALGRWMRRRSGCGIGSCRGAPTAWNGWQAPNDFCSGTEIVFRTADADSEDGFAWCQVLHNHERETLAGHYETGTCAPRTDTAHPLSVLIGCEMLTWDNVLGRGGG